MYVQVRIVGGLLGLLWGLCFPVVKRGAVKTLLAAVSSVCVCVCVCSKVMFYNLFQATLSASGTLRRHVFCCSCVFTHERLVEWMWLLYASSGLVSLFLCLLQWSSVILQTSCIVCFWEFIFIEANCKQCSVHNTALSHVWTDWCIDTYMEHPHVLSTSTALERYRMLRFSVWLVCRLLSQAYRTTRCGLVVSNSKYYCCRHHHHHLVITFIQGTYKYIPVTNHIFRICTVAAVL